MTILLLFVLDSKREKMKLNYIFPLIAVCAIICSCDDIASTDNLKETAEVDRIEVTYLPSYETHLTRAVPQTDLSCLFYNTDTLGIFAFKDNEQTAYQLTFPINLPDGVGKSSFTFSGGGWYMDTNYKYQAYTPYNYNNKDASALPVDLVGQEQDGNDNLNLLGKYFLVVSSLSSPTEDHTLSISVSLQLALAKIRLDMPAAGSYKKLYFCSKNEDFVLRTTYNMLDGSFGATPIRSKAVSLNLKNISASSVGERKILYTVLCPVDLTGKDIDIVLVDSSDNIWVAKYNGYEGDKNFPKQAVTAIWPEDMGAWTKNNAYVLPDDGSYLLNSGVTGTADDFVLVGGTTPQAD